MKLIDLLSVTNENTNVVLFSLNNKVLDIYDGKNSIDNIYNDYEVIECVGQINPKRRTYYYKLKCKICGEEKI